MKPFSKTRNLSLMPHFALCLSLLLSWSAYQVHAQSSQPAKGGELLITMGRTKATTLEKVAPAKPMSCPKCKSEWTSHPDTFARGAIKPFVWAEKHLCEGCETTITTAGVGKGKHSVPIHKCTTCGAPNEACCTAANTTGAAKAMN